LQIELERPLPSDEVHSALAAELPEHLQPVQVEVVSGQKRKHLSGLTVAEYQIELQPDAGITAEMLEDAVEEVLRAGNLPVIRETTSRTRTIDIRPGIYELTVFEPRTAEAGPRIRMKLALPQKRLVKPSEVVECLERQLESRTGQDVRLTTRVVTRLDLH
ncbi:MAG: DUF2344 domain-containing protein, partial [Armatimonadota bacterium]